MITTKPQVNISNASQQGFWEVITDNIEWIASALGIIGFISWTIGFRPKAHRISTTGFINYESDKIHEEMKFKISWGRVYFLRKMMLARIERNASLKVLCKPLGGIKDVLHMDNYIEKSSGLSTKIYLVNKNFFRNQEIEEVFLEITRTPPPSYRDNIEIHRTSQGIEVVNRNHIEIREFPVRMPRTVKVNKMPSYSSFFSRWITPKDSRRGIVAFLKSISPCVGGSPGRVFIPLN